MNLGQLSHDDPRREFLIDAIGLNQVRGPAVHRVRELVDAIEGMLHGEPAGTPPSILALRASRVFASTANA